MKILKFEMDNEEFFIELTDGILKSGKIQKDKITYNLEPEEEKLLKIICQKIFDNKFIRFNNLFFKNKEFAHFINANDFSVTNLFYL